MINIIVSMMSKGQATGTASGGTVVPLQTGFDVPVSGFPVYVRNIANTAEIGVANSYAEVAGILNGNAAWSSYGQWSGDSVLTCDGTPPAKVIAYRKVGTVLSRSILSDWSANGDSDVTLSQVANGVRVQTTNNSVAHKLTFIGYQQNFLNNVDFEFDLIVASAPIFKMNVGIDATRVLRASYSSTISIQDYAASVSGLSAGSVGFGAATYHVKLSTSNDKTTFAISSASGSVSHTMNCLPSQNEHGIGYFFIEVLQIDAVIANVVVRNNAYKNADYLVIGDSSSIRGADTFASAWPQQVIAGKPFAHCVHGDTGFILWNAAIQEAVAVDPARVLIMGSYVDTPAGLATFQSRYQAIISALKAAPNLQRIYHLATFPNNFGEDIRPFNAWKAATFNAGVDKYINSYYADLLEGSSGYDLNNAYDWGGSHITQTAHNIVANKIIANL